MAEKIHGKRLTHPEWQDCSTELQPTGLYAFAGAPTPTFPLKTNSPNSLDNDNKYDDACFMTSRIPQRQTVSSAVKERGIMVKKEAPSAFKTTRGKGQRNLHVIFLYVLVAICFVMWTSLLSLFLLKHSAISEELSTLNENYSEMLLRVKKNMDYMQKMKYIMGKALSHKFSELQEITASTCDDGRRPFNSCPPGWELQENNCYYFSKERKNWTNAQRDCINQYADLVSIWTDEEQSFLTTKVNNLTHWLGMTDLKKEGKWRWQENDLPVSTTFWDVGEPKSGEGRNCGVMQPNGIWGSTVCSLPYHWICKMMLIC